MAIFKLGIMFLLCKIVHSSEEILISFGFDARSIFVSLILYFKLYKSLSFTLNIMTNNFIRKMEYHADEYAETLTPHK